MITLGSDQVFDRPGMRPARRAALGAMATAAAGLFGCADPGSLAGLDEPVLWVEVAQSRPSQDFVTVEVQVRSSSGCVSVTTPIRATLDGETLALISEGPRSTGIASGCAVPTFYQAFTLRDSERSTVTVRDGTATFEVTVAHLLATRSVSLREPLDGTLRPGTRVVLDTTPATDAFDDPTCSVQVFPPSGQWVLGACSAPGLAVRRGEGRFEFTMPARPASAGPIDADAAMTLETVRRPRVLSCTGATRCEVAGSTRNAVQVHLSLP